MPVNFGADLFEPVGFGKKLRDAFELPFSDEDIAGAAQRGLQSTKDPWKVGEEMHKLTRSEVTRRQAGRLAEIDRTYQDAQQRAQAKAQEMRSSSTKWRLLAGLGAALAGRDIGAVNSFFDRREESGLDRELESAQNQRASALQGMQLERQAGQDEREETLFAQGQEDRSRGRDPNDARAEAARAEIRAAAQRTGLPVDPNLARLGWEDLANHPLYGKALAIWMKQQEAKSGGLSPELAYRMGRDQREDERRVEERGEARADRLEKRTGELSTPYGPARDDDSAKKLRGAYEQSQNLQRALQQMKAVRDRVGPELLEREDVAEGQTAASEAKLALKELARLGVLSATDFMFLDQMIPSDPTSFDWVPFSDPIMKKIDQAIEAAGAREKTALGAYLDPKTAASGAPEGEPTASKGPPTQADVDPGGRVRMRFPDGSTKWVPADRVEEMRELGGEAL